MALKRLSEPISIDFDRFSVRFEVVFPLYLTFVALTGCGPPRVQSICSYILRRFKRRSKFNYHKAPFELLFSS